MTKPPSPRPLSIKIIIVYFTVITATGTLGLLLWIIAPDGIRSITPANVPHLGFALSIDTARLFSCIFIPLHGYAVFGLWKLRAQARQLAIGLTIYALMNAILCTLSPITRELTTATYQSAGTPPLVVWFLNARLLSISSSIVIIWFLIKRKSAFVKPAPPVQT